MLKRSNQYHTLMKTHRCREYTKTWMKRGIINLSRVLSSGKGRKGGIASVEVHNEFLIRRSETNMLKH